MQKLSSRGTTRRWKAQTVTENTGEIMPEERVLFLVQASDMFEVVKLEKGFVEKYKDQFAKNPIITEDIVALTEDGRRTFRNRSADQ